MLSQRINRIQPSPTLAVSARAKAMRAAGEDVISFDAGEPDYDTPQHIKDACIAALQNGDTKYTAAPGTPKFREVISQKMKRFNDLEYSADEIVVSSGGKHSLYNIFQSILDDGDEVLIPAPYWVSYPDQVKLAGGIPVVLQTSADSGFKISPEQLEETLKEHPNAKAFVMNSPSNPSGAVYSPDALKKLCEVLEKYPNVLVISDELYENMVYAPALQWSMAKFSPEFQKRCVIVQGLSKTYAMTGWRLGWTASTPELAKAMGKLQSQSTSNPTSFAQAGGIAALEGPLPTEMLAAFEKRGHIARELLSDIPGFTVPKPEGAFYLFPKVSGLFGVMVGKDRQINTATDLTNYLLEVAKVAAVPGEGFGAPEHVRFSYANSVENIKEGVRRILQVLPE
ncbi:aspartate aminotransferase [Abditibacterium utsteinense]|uniref:Aminotransferase n=1 Tax=Abditibacterium utsteinense TaxID=1960156 RepID=A0A2S8SP38_9BACT|nr:pyridoxal phosphate-dependent aminotransferase [Abditibacterium utsteinense]PQV62558.1 aspartate aminotransferase [Abditibacterium utsteinense]